MADDDLEEEIPSEPPAGGARERFKSRLESVIPEILKRAVEIGVEKARESPDNLKHLVTDLKVPKEVAHYLLQQIDETKNGMFRVVAKEMRDFLEHTNFAGEMQKLLTTVQFEINTTIRFTPNDGPKKDDDGGADGENGAPPESGEESGRDRARSSDAPPAEREGRSTETRLPRPEVKTAVHVRDVRDRKRRAK